MIRKALLIVSLFAIPAALVVEPTQVTEAHARTTHEAESQRLRQEMAKLARRNVMKGVNRAYNALYKIRKKKGVTVTGDDHFLGAQASRALGYAGDTHGRLTRGKKAGHDESSSNLDAFNSAFGKVEIKKRKKSERTLARAQSPFAPDQRSAIKTAAERMKKKGKFKGYLPAGDYTVGKKKFTVTAGQEVKVKRK